MNWSKKAILKIGHRGASGYEPENTLRSLEKALVLGVDMIEFDVHICKSGEVVVIHDGKVNRTTHSKGFVRDKTLDELKKLDAGKGEKIPTLEEVLDFVNHRVAVNIELKGEKTTKPVYAIIKKYIENRNWSYKDFLVSSFDDSKLREIRKLDSKIEIGLLPKRTKTHIVSMISELSAYSVHCSYKSKGLLNKNFIELLHKQGVKIFAWTVNDKKNIERLKILGVDGIFSDYPDML